MRWISRLGFPLSSRRSYFTAKRRQVHGEKLLNFPNLSLVNKPLVCEASRIWIDFAITEDFFPWITNEMKEGTLRIKVAQFDPETVKGNLRDPLREMYNFLAEEMADIARTVSGKSIDTCNTMLFEIQEDCFEIDQIEDPEDFVMDKSVLPPCGSLDVIFVPGFTSKHCNLTLDDFERNDGIFIPKPTSTFVILPQFEKLDSLMKLRQDLESLPIDKTIFARTQTVLFHPKFKFYSAGDEKDILNYCCRSPFPMLHFTSYYGPQFFRPDSHEYMESILKPNLEKLKKIGNLNLVTQRQQVLQTAQEYVRKQQFELTSINDFDHKREEERKSSKTS